MEEKVLQSPVYQVLVDLYAHEDKLRTQFFHELFWASILSPHRRSPTMAFLPSQQHPPFVITIEQTAAVVISNILFVRVSKSRNDSQRVFLLRTVRQSDTPGSIHILSPKPLGLKLD